MKKKRETAVITGVVLLALILISVIVALIVLLAGKSGQEDREDEPEGYVMEEENYRQIMEDMRAEVREGYFETYMSTEWIFPDGTSETEDTVLGNSPNNTKPIRCEVTLRDTDEVVFSTGVIPVGVELPAFKLDMDLDAGRYDAVCTVYLLDELENGTYKDYSSAGFNVTIIVEN